MYKISQREILSEGFWHEFSEKPAARNVAKVGSWVSSIGSVVAPEIADPLKKGVDWMRSSKEKSKRAGMSKDQISMEYIMEDGFFPNPPDSKIRWNKKQNADGTYTGTIKVGELENDVTTGEPKLGRTFAIDKSTYIFKFNPKDRTAKRVKGPERHLATSHDEIMDALEQAGHDVVRRLQHITTRPNGTITGTASIRDSSGATNNHNFVYDTNTGQVTIT
jgi:hypothetical protein